MLSSLIETLQAHAQRALDSSVQSQLAQRLGWVMVTGTEAAKAKPVLTLVHDADRAGAEVMDRSDKYDKETETIERSLKAFEMFPGADLILSVMQVVCGRREEQDVYIFPGSEGGGKNRPSRKKLDIVVLMKTRLDLKLHIYPEQFFSKVGKFLFCLQDIQVGDPQIDEAFMIKATDSQAPRQLLSDSEVRTALLALLEEPYPRPVINDVAVRATIYLPLEVDQVIEQIDKLSKLAAALSNRSS